MGTTLAKESRTRAWFSGVIGPSIYLLIDRGAVGSPHGDMIARREARQDRSRDTFRIRQKRRKRPAPALVARSNAFDQRRTIRPLRSGIAQRIADRPFEH